MNPAGTCWALSCCIFIPSGVTMMADCHDVPGLVRLWPDVHRGSADGQLVSPRDKHPRQPVAGGGDLRRATALFIVQTFLPASMMHRSCSSTGKSQTPSRAKTRPDTNAWWKLFKLLFVSRRNILQKIHHLALSRTGKACYNETKKAPHPAQKQNITPQAKGAITMAWKDNFDTIKSTAAVVAQSAAQEDAAADFRYKGQLGHSRRGRQN